MQTWRSVIPSLITIPTYVKERIELRYWSRKKAEEGTLAHDHYCYFYTEHFGFRPSDYAGRRILDIGGGPRGSLEWADMAARLVGLDPFAGKYKRLGVDRHKMEYVTAGSEHIPFPDASFHVVCSFNSLDHVENVQATIREIKRVTRTDGFLFLLVKVNHKPTAAEPHRLTPALIEGFAPEFAQLKKEIYAPHETRPLPISDGTRDSCRVGEFGSARLAIGKTTAPGHSELRGR